jgi:hypothetical protein
MYNTLLEDQKGYYLIVHKECPKCSNEMAIKYVCNFCKFGEFNISLFDTTFVVLVSLHNTSANVLAV